MKLWRNTLVPPTATIRDAIEKIDSNATQIALVVDEAGRLLGTITDGDVRRGLLAGTSLDDAVACIMNPKPTVAHHHQSQQSILNLMRDKVLYQMPVVNDAGVVVGLEVLKTLMGHTRLNPVVIMAGGLGTRLRPHTETCPKPMLKIGGKPILETILENFVDQGFRRFYFAVNYMAEKIEHHFGNGSDWGVDIGYLHEPKRLGTAGALSLLPERPETPLLVMNGDLLTQVNFGHMLDFHTEHQAAATMAVREYEFQVPFGVVNLETPRIMRIDEKPTQHFFVNAGIYALQPEALDVVPAGEHLDMTTLFDRLIAQQRVTAAFPIREYWLDIGRLDDFERARNDFANGVNV